MAIQKMNISLNDFIVNEVIGNTANRSNRIAELILKGWKAEMQEKRKNVVLRISSHNLTQDRINARSFIALMLSGHCTQTRAVGQVYSGMGATV